MDIKTLFESLDRLYIEGNCTAIEHLLLNAISDFESAGKKNTPECASVLNELAGFYRGVSRYADSLQAFELSLTILSQSNLENTAQYATVLLNLAGLYRLAGRFDDSLKSFLKAKSLLESGTDPYAYVSVLNNISLLYQDIGELDTGYEYASKALEFIRSNGSSEHETASSLNNLACFCIKMGRLDEARKLILEALSIYDAMPGNVHHSAALSTMATIYYQCGDYEDALKTFERSLSLTERSFGRNIEYATTLNSIALTYKALGNKAKALENQCLACELIEDILGKDHPRAIEYRCGLL